MLPILRSPTPTHPRLFAHPKRLARFWAIQEEFGGADRLKSKLMSPRKHLPHQKSKKSKNFLFSVPAWRPSARRVENRLLENLPQRTRDAVQGPGGFGLRFKYVTLLDVGLLVVFVFGAWKPRHHRLFWPCGVTTFAYPGRTQKIDFGHLWSKSLVSWTNRNFWARHHTQILRIRVFEDV